MVRTMKIGRTNFYHKEESTYNHDSNYYRILVKNSIDAIDFIDRNKNLLTDFEVVKGSMDDVFLNLTGVRNMEEGK